MRVEVIYALADRQWLVSVEVEKGVTALEAARAAVEAKDFPRLDLTNHALGIFSKKVESDYVLRPHDRVEIYRPLKADPKEVRRALAAAGETMGKRR